MRIFTKNRVSLAAILIFLVLGFGKTEAADNIILKDLNGRSVNFSNYKGRPAIIFFWTTWCRFCRDEIRGLNQNYNKIEKEGIAVFVVNASEPEYKVRRFFKHYTLNFRAFLDEDGLLADKYNIMGVPTYIFLDKSGRVITKKNILPANYKSLLLKN